MIAEAQEFIDILLFRSGFNTRIVMLGVTALGVAAGPTGVFVLLRKRAMISDAVAHCTLPGLAAAFLFAYFLNLETRSYSILIIGAVISSFIGLAFIHLISKYTRIAEETSIGAILSVFFGFGIVLLSAIQSLGSGDAAGLNHFIYGQTASMLQADAWRLLVICSLALIVSLLFMKEFRLLCFDNEFAQTQGWPTTIIDAAMLLLLLVVVVMGLQTVGILLIIAMLIVPATAARFWTESLRTMLVVSALVGGVSAYLGAAMSAMFPRMPTGAVIVLCSGFLFTVSFLFAPRRGLLSSIVRSILVRLRVIRDHVLRDIYEQAEVRGIENWETEFFVVNKAVMPKLQGLLLKLPFFSRYLLSGDSSSSVRVTQAGKELALRLTRNHRLWESYMIEYAGIAASHVDYSADRVEHVLSEDLVRQLEEQLRQKGELPERIVSVHPIR